MTTAIEAPRVTAETRLIDISRVQARLSIGKSTVYEWIKLGYLKPPCKVGSTSRWPEDEIDALIARLKSERDGEPPESDS